GGNCELTQTRQTVVKHGVTIIGRINIATGVPYHASQMYARNLTAFLLHLVKDGKLRLDVDDEIIRDTLVTRDGEVVNERVREFFALPALVSQTGDEERADCPERLEKQIQRGWSRSERPRISGRGEIVVRCSR